MGEYVAESDPLNAIKTILEENWVEHNEIPLPNLVVTNLMDSQELRFNLNDGDYIVIRQDSAESFKNRGNFIYYDRLFPITLDCWTKESRQRIRDMNRVIRAICLDKKHDFPGYQLIRLGDYNEETNQNQNIWRAVIHITVESAGVYMDTL